MDRQFGSRKQLRSDPKAEGYMPNMVETWVVEVKDMNKPKKPSIGLFDWENDRHLHVPWRAGSLDTSFCHAEADARRVGEAACVLLDRFPKSLVGWEQVVMNPGKRMVETLCIVGPL